MRLGAGGKPVPVFRDHVLAAGHFAEEDAAFGLGGSRRLDQRYRDLIGSRAGILHHGLRDVFYQSPLLLAGSDFR